MSVLFDRKSFCYWQSYNNISALSDHGKYKNLISCWWRAVCTLGGWREVRWSRWRTGINLTLLILWCLRLSISLSCVAFSDVMLLCISSASIHVPFVSLDSFHRFAGILCPSIIFFFSSLPHFIIFPLSLFLSYVRLLLSIRRYPQGVAEASRAFISLINSLPHSLS